MNSVSNKIIITVSGGIAYVIQKPAGVEIELEDFDMDTKLNILTDTVIYNGMEINPQITGAEC